MAKAFITGITGQDGSYLTELLLEKGYEVHGVVRRTSSLERSRLSHLYENTAIYGKQLFFHYADLDDPTTLRRILTRVLPDEVYHLAGQSHVGLSFEIAESTCEMTAMGTLRLLEMMRDLSTPPRIYHATTSEIFGRPDRVPQDETTPLNPISPYGCAKAFATQLVRVYREAFGLFVCNGIMYNHESPRRGENFLTRKVCRTVAAIKAGRQRELLIGDTSARRDWGYAPDYVRGMWLAVNYHAPEDFLFASGEMHTVQEVVEIAFETAGLDWREHVRLDERFLRPADPQQLVGNATKAREVLGWRPTVSFQQLIALMTEAELVRAGVEA